MPRDIRAFSKLKSFHTQSLSPHINRLVGTPTPRPSSKIAKSTPNSSESRPPEKHLHFSEDVGNEDHARAHDDPMLCIKNAKMESVTFALGRNFLAVPTGFLQKCRTYVRLAEVGKLETPKPAGKYETGQLILHRVFGYRGVVLFPWLARVYDRDLPQHREGDEEPIPGVGKEVRGRTHLFYQVLIDQRDCPFIRAQTEAVTFLGNQESSRSLYAIPGLDYVAHDDIIPYTSAERTPLQHELFDKFLAYNAEKDPPFVAQETLRAWQNKNHPWLELSDVHKETTENIRVTVIPFYMGCRESHTNSVYWWRYCIRLENLGALAVQLRERHWRIFSLSGTLETVRGRGVVGQEPALTRTLPAFQYSSHVSLQAPSGHMWGTFRMEREDGYTFDCRIPPFSLESKAEGGAASPPDSV